jgi:hypothetical protein
MVNPERNTKKKKSAVHSRVNALKDTRHLGRQTSHFCVQTKLDSFFKPAILLSKASTTSESSINE